MARFVNQNFNRMERYVGKVDLNTEMVWDRNRQLWLDKVDAHLLAMRREKAQKMQLKVWGVNGL